MEDVPMTTPDPISAAGLARPRLLVVDDLKDNRILLTRRLRARGYEVVEAADGFEALAIIACQTFDCVLLDVVMPGMDGFQVLRAIRERHSDRDLPVIMATVKDDAQDVVQALREGANDYIVKPIDFAVVRESDRRPDEDREDSRDHSCTTPRRHDGHGITRADEPRRSMIFRSVFCS